MLVMDTKQSDSRTGGVGPMTPSRPELALAHRERDDLRAEVVELRDVLARMRDAAELQKAAEQERDAVVQHLQAALTASGKADELRRRALAELEQAIAGMSTPGHAGALISNPAEFSREENQ